MQLGSKSFLEGKSGQHISLLTTINHLLHVDLFLHTYVGSYKIEGDSFPYRKLEDEEVRQTTVPSIAVRLGNTVNTRHLPAPLSILDFPHSELPPLLLLGSMLSAPIV